MKRLLMTLMLFAIPLSGSIGVAEAGGRCVSAQVPSTMVLPDGSRHVPGRIRLCLAHKLSPVAGLHEIRIDGVAEGMYISRMGMSEGPTAEGKPFLSFRRTRSGELILEGYAVPARDRMTVYRIERTVGRPGRRQWPFVASGTTDADEPVIFQAEFAD